MLSVLESSPDRHGPPKGVLQLLAGFSLANLMFFRVWPGILGMQLRYMAKAPITSEFIAMFAAVTLFGGMFWGLFFFATRDQAPLAQKICRWCLFVLVLASFRPARIEVLLFDQTRLPVLGVLFWVGGLISILIVLSKFEAKCFHFLRASCLILSPFLIVTLSQLFWATKTSMSENYLDLKNTQVSQHSSQSRRVVFIVFDELDERVAFSSRPVSIKLPELDRFKAQALFAENAYPPSNATITSLPAYILGRKVLAARPRAVNDLAVAFENGNTVSWGSQPNLFDRARLLGVNTALIGWYHPYCRLIVRSLNECSWMQDPDSTANLDVGFSQRLFNLLYLGLNGALRVADWSLLDPDKIFQKLREEKVRSYRQLMLQAETAASDGSLGLVMLHLPLPHSSSIYSRKAGAFSTEKGLSYLDNLSLVDSTLGDLRSRMQASGQWESTTVIATSDHSWRTNIWRNTPSWTREDAEIAGNTIDRRVPFLVKMPKQTKEILYQPAFNTVDTSTLILEILSGRIADGDSLKKWLDEKKVQQHS
jgi:hypothetical protein